MFPHRNYLHSLTVNYFETLPLETQAAVTRIFEAMNRRPEEGLGEPVGPARTLLVWISSSITEPEWKDRALVEIPKATEAYLQHIDRAL